jgi:hypothetical protein
VAERVTVKHPETWIMAFEGHGDGLFGAEEHRVTPIWTWMLRFLTQSELTYQFVSKTSKLCSDSTVVRGVGSAEAAENIPDIVNHCDGLWRIAEFRGKAAPMHKPP